MKYFFRFCFYLVYVGFSVSKKAKHENMEGLIVGGVVVDITKFPAAGRIINMGAMCGCSVLNSFSVLTAAHCFEQNTDVDEITVHLGVTFLYDPKTMVRDAREVQIHSDYNKAAAFACDIAIVFLADAIEFGKHVKKALLVDTQDWKNKREKEFHVIGWGWTKYGGEISTLLRMATMRFVPQKTCSRMHNATFTSDMFCLYGEGKDDACKGDSGGGAYWKGKLVGVVSHGDGCAKRDKPTVYTNVYFYRKWIQNKLEKYLARLNRQKLTHMNTEKYKKRTVSPRRLSSKQRVKRNKQHQRVIFVKKMVIVGLVSHGDGCAKKDKPTVYTNVWVFRTWIEEKLIQFTDECESITTSEPDIEMRTVLPDYIKDLTRT